ncbi:MAG: hypothetical protein Q9190_002823 [Brigantiaea leucoxantha]
MSFISTYSRVVAASMLLKSSAFTEYMVSKMNLETKILKSRVQLSLYLGPIIRINPHEVHIDDPKWHDTLYASNPTRRDKWPPAAEMTGTNLGPFGTIEHDIHRKRRAANSRILSISAVTSAESLIKDQVEHLSKNFQGCYKKGQILELRTRFLAFTTDTVALHALGESMGLQDDDLQAEEWNRTIRAVAKLTSLVKQFPWIINLFKKLPLGMLQRLAPDLARILQLHQGLVYGNVLHSVESARAQAIAKGNNDRNAECERDSASKNAGGTALLGK